MENKQSKTLGVFTLAMINVAAIVSLRGLPAEALYGLSSIFYYIFAALFFLIPVSLVSAELGTGWAQKGGVFRWIGEAFGARAGFIAIFLQWLQNTIWFPTALTFAAVSLAFIDTDLKFDAMLAGNKYYTLAIVLSVYWASTIVNFLGVKMSGAISKWGSIIGTLIPGVTIIGLGVYYYFSGNAVNIDFKASELIPNLSKFSNVSLAVSIFLFYAGMEMSSVHVTEVENPKKNYPKAIFLASIVTVFIFVVGTLAIAAIIPKKDINLTQSLFVSYYKVFDLLNMKYLGSVMAVFLAFGVFGQVTTWIAGPSKGLLAVGRAGYLPLFLQKQNAKGVQVNILIVQASIVTFLSIIFVLLPSVQAAYQILTALCVTLYLIMYIMMFLAFVKLRISEPHVERAFKVPGGFLGMCIIGGVGLLSSTVAFFFGFIPPNQIEVGSNTMFIMLLVIGNVIGVGIPFLIYSFKKPSWKSDDPTDEFEPFSWEKEKKNPMDNINL